MAEPESLADRARAGARRWLENCGVDPDDLASIRNAYEIARDDFARGAQRAVLNAWEFENLIGAIKVANGWDELPADWPQFDSGGGTR